jgi:Amidohydrolase family/IPT/TIG domain
MRTTRVLLGILITAMLAFGAPAIGQAQAPTALLIKGATIIDGISDTALRDRSLLIEGNIIKDVLPSSAATPAGAQILDLSGKFIIPGLFDSHVHWEEWMGELYANHGVTSLVALTNVPKALRTKSQTASDLPRLFHSGGRPQFSETASEAEIRQAIRTWLRNEPDLANFPTHNDSMSRAYAIAADEVHKAGLLVFGHAENAPAALRDGMDIVEHVWGFTQATMSPQNLRSFQEGKFLTWATFMTDWNRLDSMIADSVSRGAYLNPTLHYEWGGMSRRAKQREYEDYLTLSDPNLVYFPRNIADSILARQRQIKNFSTRYENMPWIGRLPAEDRKEFETGFKNVLDFTKRYVAAGGKIQAGTDTITGGTPGLSLHHEMEVLVEAGLTPMQALKAATSWSAELVEGKNKARGNAKVGSIRAGNFADLVVISADPLNDISNTKKIERVMKDGRWLELVYHPEYYTFVRPANPLAASTFAPVISALSPSSTKEGSPPVRVVVDGSGFTTTSLVRVGGISVKTTFRNPRQIEFDLPASAIEHATPNPYSAPGPAQNVGIVGYRTVAVHVFNPPPEGGISNTVHELVLPK